MDGWMGRIENLLHNGLLRGISFYLGELLNSESLQFFFNVESLVIVNQRGDRY